MPADVIVRSQGPIARSACAIADVTASRSATSTGTASTRCDGLAQSGTSSARAASSTSARRASSVTLAPRRTSSRAVSFPMPLDPPVTMAC